MAGVKIEIPNQNRGVHEYEKFNLADKECVEWLIKLRSEIDESFKTQMFSNNNPFEASDIPNFRELISIMYIDLEVLIRGCGFTPTQLLVINKLMMGYDLADIDEMFLEQNYGLSETIFDMECDRIVEEADRVRTEWYKKMGFNVQEKKCSKCGEIKLVTKFDKDNRSKDGLHSNCKKCRKITSENTQKAEYGARSYYEG